MLLAGPGIAGLLGLALAAMMGAAGCGGDASEEAPAEATVAPAPKGSPNARPELVAQLQADRDAVRHPSDGKGFARFDADGEESLPPVVAGQGVRLPIVFEVGPLGIAAGGAVFLQVPPFWGWSGVQLERPDAPGYTTVATDAADVELDAQVLDRYLLAVFVRGRALAEGEVVEIVFGAGPALARADRFAERLAPFHLAVDGDGDGVRELLPEPLTVDVVAGPPDQLVAHAPSVVRPGQPIPLRVCALDAVGNAGVDIEGLFRAWIADAEETVHAGALDEQGCGGVDVRTVQTGLLVVSVAGPEGLVTTSNPVLVSEEAPDVLWGDLHGHSYLSDGTGSPEDYYRYARDVAALDVASLTDHDHWGMPFLDTRPEQWERIRQVVRRHDEPGVFVSLLGYEWTSWLYGHRHVLYFGEGGELLSSFDETTDHPTELWDALRGQPALTFAHHSAGDPIATDWTIAPDPELEPVTEIVSVHGSSESADTVQPVQGGRPGHYVRDALARGYPLGFIGSGDSHDGHPGLTHLAARSGGLAAILAPERTRESVLAALRARRTYATNGPRILVHATLDGEPIGSDLPLAPTHRLDLRVAGTAPLSAIEVVVGQAVLANLLDAPTDAITLETTLEPPQDEPQTLYLRIRQQDGGTAWTSPFFLHPSPTQ